MSDRQGKSKKKQQLDPRLEAHRLMKEFVNADESSQVHTREIAIHVATAWALLSIADSLATREGLRAADQR